jgi:hypothetical protein
MREIFREILDSIDNRLASYFLVKGGRLEVAPLSKKEYDNLIANGYEPVTEGNYEQLDRRVLEALNKILHGLGNRALLLFPLAVSAIISHEASRDGSELHDALYSQKDSAAETREGKEVGQDKKQKRKRE